MGRQKKKKKKSERASERERERERMDENGTNRRWRCVEINTDAVSI